MNAYEVLGWFMIGLSVTMFGAYLGMLAERKRWRRWLKERVR